MPERYAAGGNFTIDITDGIVDVVVWRRPDLDVAQGAELARQKVEHLGTLAARRDIVGVLMNLTAAPPVVGPKTQEALAAMLRGFVARDKRIAMVVGDSPTQRLQVERLLRSVLKRDGCVVPDAAAAWLFLRA